MQGNSKAKVRIGNRNTDTFSINNGLKQGQWLVTIANQYKGDRIRQNITMDTYNFKCVSQFQYLGAVITSDKNENTKGE